MKRKKKQVFIERFFLGSYFGTFIAMMFGGLIAAHWSWEWIFYLSGKFYKIEKMIEENIL